MHSVGQSTTFISSSKAFLSVQHKTSYPLSSVLSLLLPQHLATTHLLLFLWNHLFWILHTDIIILHDHSHLVSLTEHHIFKVHPHCSMYSGLHSFQWLNNTPFHRYTTMFLFIHSLMEICIISTFWLLWMMLSNFKKYWFIHLFIWMSWVLVAAHRISDLHCGMWTL